MTWEEIIKLVGTGLGTFILTMLGKSAYQGSKQEAKKEGSNQVAAASVAAFQPMASQYRAESFEKLLGEVHADVCDIKRRVELIEEIVKEEKSDRDAANKRDAEAFRSQMTGRG